MEKFTNYFIFKHCFKDSNKNPVKFYNKIIKISFISTLIMSPILWILIKKTIAYFSLDKSIIEQGTVHFLGIFTLGTISIFLLALFLFIDCIYERFFCLEKIYDTIKNKTLNISIESSGRNNYVYNSNYKYFDSFLNKDVSIFNNILDENDFNEIYKELKVKNINIDLFKEELKNVLNKNKEKNIKFKDIIDIIKKIEPEVKKNKEEESINIILKNIFKDEK